MTSDGLKAGVAYVADEYGKEWQRKGALETRAFAIGTADFALATLYGIWIDRLSLLDNIGDSAPAKWVFIGAFVVALLAFGLAVAAAIMFRFKGANPDVFDGFLTALTSGRLGDDEALDEIARTYLAQLRAARSVNAKKFGLLAAATALMSCASVAAAGCLVLVGT